jgi:hypothetical protein
MKITYPNFLLIFITFILSGTLSAQDEKYDAVYGKLIKEYTLNPDGSIDYRYIKQQKLQTYRAFHNLYGETFIVYDTVNQKLKINEVFTIMADGKKVAAPSNSFNEILPGVAANAPAYNYLREMVITHTGLERNATVNLDYQLHSNKGLFPFLSGNEILAEYEPVNNLEIRVRVPAGTKLYYRVFNLDLKPQQVQENNYQVFIWKRSDVAAISAEEGQPGGYSAYPRLVFSTSDKPAEAYNYLTNQPAFRFNLTDGLKAEVTELKNKYLNKFELALKIQEIVVDEMRTYPIPFRTALCRIRTPEQSWNSNGATPAEKAVLLTAMLRSAGLDARVAVVVRTAFSDDKIATLGNIEDFAVRVDFKEEGAWYFSVAEQNSVNLKHILTSLTFILLNPDGKFETEKSEVPENQIRAIGNFIVTSDPKLTGDVSLYFGGNVFPQAGMVKDKKTMRNAFTGNLIKNDTSALKKSILNNENGFQTYIVQSDKPFRQDSGFWFFRLPVVSSGVESWNIRTLSEKRETAYEIPSIADESYSYTFTMPATLALFTPAKKQTISNKAGTYNWEVTSENGKVTVKRSLKFNDQVFPLSVYPEFKVLMDNWNNPWYRVLVFKQDAGLKK